ARLARGPLPERAERDGPRARERAPEPPARPGARRPVGGAPARAAPRSRALGRATAPRPRAPGARLRRVTAARPALGARSRITDPRDRIAGLAPGIGRKACGGGLALRRDRRQCPSFSPSRQKPSVTSGIPRAAAM